MGVKLSQLASALESLAPLELAEPWDRPGLQLGDPNGLVQGVVVSLDPCEAAVSLALQHGANLLVTHHPLLLRPLQQVDLSTPRGRLLARCLSAGIAIYSAHTNLDRAERGVNDRLAEVLGLDEVRSLSAGDALCKLVVTVPVGYEAPVRDALALAGAGRLGEYSDCSFSTRGVGRFLPLGGARPFLGRVGCAATVSESRLEVVVPRSRLAAARSALIEAHPYEEPAVDVYDLRGTGAWGGLGRVGKLAQPEALGEFSRRAARILGARAPRLVGDPARSVVRVAVCGGSGADLWPAAVKAGADVLVTGDVKYHAALEAADAGLALLDVGHGPSERAAVEVMADLLRSWGARLDPAIAVTVHESEDIFEAVRDGSSPG